MSVRRDRGTQLSQSVTSGSPFRSQVLQIEMERGAPPKKSQSVTPSPLLTAQLLQIETNGTTTKGTGTFVLVHINIELAPNIRYSCSY